MATQPSDWTTFVKHKINTSSTADDILDFKRKKPIYRFDEY